MPLFMKTANEVNLNVESRYLRKFHELLGWPAIEKAGKEYASAPLLFQPIRDRLTREEQESLCLDIMMNQKLTVQEKLDTLMGLTMFWDGLSLDQSKMSGLEVVFGKGFTDAIRSLEKESQKQQSETVEQKLIAYVKRTKLSR